MCNAWASSHILKTEQSCPHQEGDAGAQTEACWPTGGPGTPSQSTPGVPLSLLRACGHLVADTHAGDSRMIPRAILAASMLAAAGCSSALTPEDPTNVGSWMELYGVPGVSIAVIKRNRDSKE